MTVPLSKKVKAKSSEQSFKALITRGAKQSQAAAEGEILMLSCPSGFLQSHIWGSIFSTLLGYIQNRERIVKKLTY